MIQTSQDTSARIIQLWMEISRLLRRKMVATKSADPSCMNPMQMHGMAIIADHPKITMKEFAEQLHISSPSATSFVDRLVKLQWIARSANQTNRKLVHLDILPEGKVALEKAMRAHSAVMHELFSLLSDADQSQLEQVLTHLKEALAHTVSPR